MTTTTFANGSLFTRAGAGSKFGGTQLSTASRKTSKTKRKEERKRARGKKGSVYEEEYLVNSLARLIERWNGTHEEVRRLLGGLARRGRREEARTVMEGMEEVQTLLSGLKSDIWPPSEPSETGQDCTLAGSRPSGADGVFWDSQVEVGEGGGASKEAPEVKAFKGSEVFV
ncbi:Elongator complex protein 1 [Cyphellophora attinorum]|uniref:Elongator complex protein 1 n=1 Tax=Cyphellophora attinorum TaxID=1664694 RepID=A0A0N0NQJ5_9EURO|nr:Elongator complex protein 1 [Phialophora attinorum]KPI43981.1 Elongator complex protein 1 [Phialophora attinorum]